MLDSMIPVPQKNLNFTIPKPPIRQPAAEPEEWVNLTVLVPLSLRRRLKMQAAKRDQTLAALITPALERLVSPQGN